MIRARAAACGLALAALTCDPPVASAPVDGDAPALASSSVAAIEPEPEPAPAPTVAASDRPPDDPAALGAWLRGGGYREWIPQGPVHPTGEHGGARVLFNPRLAASFAAGAALHEIGAAAVRELYEPDLATPRGFALMVKTTPGWYWYEVFGVGDDAAPTVSQVAAPGCVGCHDGGVDLVMPPEGAGPDPAGPAAPAR